MTRKICLAIVTMAVLSAAGEARAQYGYAGRSGYGGYGGWGSTPGSSMARGMGMFSMGAVCITNTPPWPDRSTPTPP